VWRGSALTAVPAGLLRRLLAPFGNDALGERPERREVAPRYLEYDLRVDPMMGVTQQVSKVHHLLPIDGCLLLFDVYGNSMRCFADNLESPFDREAQRQIGREIARRLRRNP
jgi:hypothetical protein